MAWSGQEGIAYRTGYEDAIYGRPQDNPYNPSTAPRSVIAYDEGYTDGSGSTTPPRGSQGEQGDQGPAGPQGAQGLPGANGADGLSLEGGNGPPLAGDGNVGDKYIDYITGDIYEKTGVSTWTYQGNVSDVPTFAVEVDDTGGSPNVIYKGEANPGSAAGAALWRIQQITITTDGGGNDDIAILWADGDSNFDNIWNNRLSLSYS